jgi:proliferating cell nuclear antigen
MRFQTIQASAVKSAFEVLKDILNDVNIYFSPAGLRILTLDTARVALVDMFLPAENFEQFQSETLVAGVNVTNMFKLLKFISNNDTLTMEVRRSAGSPTPEYRVSPPFDTPQVNNREYLDIRIENATKKTDTKFQLKLLDINEDQIEVRCVSPLRVQTVSAEALGDHRSPTSRCPASPPCPPSTFRESVET